MLLQGPKAAGGPSGAAPTHLRGEQLQVLGLHALVETAVLYVHQEAAGARGQAPGRRGKERQKVRADLLSYPFLALSSSPGGRVGIQSPPHVTSLGLTWMRGWNSEVLNSPPFRNVYRNV